MTRYQKRMIRAVQALNLIKSLSNEDDLDLLVTTLEVLALKIKKEKVRKALE